MRQLYLLIFLFFIIENQLPAQVDTLFLPEVKLTAEVQKNHSLSGKYTLIDSVFSVEKKYAHIDELLSEQADVQVQNYGLGQSASVSIRGMAASHTKLYWQDVPLNSNMLGQADFSLVPTALFSDITLSHGASGSPLGSGGFGGMLMLGNNAILGEKNIDWLAGQQISDTGSSTTLLDVHYSGEQKGGQTKLISINSLNSFRYVNQFEAGKPVQRAENARFHQHHLMQSFAFRTNKIGTIQSHIWAMDSRRYLAFSKAVQQDRALRAVSSLENKNYDFTLAYTRELLDYRDESLGIFSDSHSQRVYARGRIRGSTHYVKHESGMIWMWDKARAEGYPSGKGQLHASVFSHNQFTFKYLNIKINLREEWQAGQFSPFLYTVNISPRLTFPFKLELTHSRNIHYPTFNDRYWQPGGNPDLQPEKAFHWEVNLAGITMPNYTDEQHYFSVKTNLALYHTRLDNRIQWQPTNAGYWAAFNIKNVHSTGIEIEIPVQYVTEQWRLQWTNMYALTNAKDKTPDSENYNHQLPYIPLHKWSNTLRLAIPKQGWSCVYRHGVTSRRFTSGDHSLWLPTYHTGSLSGSYDLSVKSKLNMRIDLSVNNLWNKDYEVIRGYPMPLRYVTLGLSVRPQ